MGVSRKDDEDLPPEGPWNTPKPKTMVEIMQEEQTIAKANAKDNHWLGLLAFLLFTTLVSWVCFGWWGLLWGFVGSTLTVIFWGFLTFGLEAGWRRFKNRRKKNDD